MFCSDSAQLSFVLWVLGYLGCASIVDNAASAVLSPTSRASDPAECGPRCKVLFACYTEDDKLLPICHAAAKTSGVLRIPCSNRARAVDEKITPA
jgi:hypothetical protein